jgi:drug/metabolite transporter (DMT)-like permease
VAFSLVGLLVALGSAGCWAGLDATRKALVRDVDPLAATAWVNLAQAPLFGGWALLSATRLEPEYWSYGAGAAALQIGANVLLFQALKVSPLSVTIPFLSFTPVFAALLGRVVLDERPTALQWVGIAVVVVGALSVHAGGERSLWRALREERGSLYAVIVAALWSLTSNLDKLALEHATLPVHAALQVAAVGGAVTLWLLARGQARRLVVPAGARAPLAGSVVFGAAALGLQLWAIQLMLVGAVETIKRAVGMTSAVAVGRLAFDEAVTAEKVLGVALLVLGTAMLAFGRIPSGW